MVMKVNGTSGLTFPDTTTLASAGQSSVRAWVNFNGTGTVAIRASYNVSSITDNGAGDYTVNFTTAMPDVNYGIGANAGYGPGGSGRYVSAPTSNGFATDFLTTSVRLNSVYAYNSPQDCEVVSIAVFR